MTKGISEPKNDRQGFSKLKQYLKLCLHLFINLLTGLQTATKMVKYVRPII